MSIRSIYLFKMQPYVIYAAALLAAYTVYSFISSFLTARRHAQKAVQRGCKPPKQRPYTWPLGVEFMLRLVKADKEKVLPDEFLRIARELGVPTWEQNFLGDHAIVTLDPKNIQAILATQFQDFELGESRRGNFFPLLGHGIFTNDGKRWEHSRAMLRPQFAREQISDLELEEVHVQDLFQHLPTGSDGWTAEVDLQPIFFRLTLDSATEFLFGESVNTQIAALSGAAAEKQSTKDTGKLDWTGFGPCFDGATMNLGSRGRLGDKYWIYTPSDFKENCTNVHKFADYYVNLALTTNLYDLKRQNVGNLERGPKKQEYIFLAELVKSTRDPVELRSQLLNILLAGRDTTAGLLGFAFYSLVRNPDIYTKLRGIILDTFGAYEQPRNITFATLKGCTYLQHVLSETLRMYTSVPINSRRAVCDTTIPRGGGPDGMSPVYVKKGQEMNYTVHAMHHWKSYWGEDADEFKPERWRKYP